MGKGKSSDFRGFLYTGSELTQFQETQNAIVVPPVRIGTYGGQVIKGLLAQVLLTVGAVGPQSYSVVISPVLEWKYMRINCDRF